MCKIKVDEKYFGAPIDIESLNFFENGTNSLIHYGVPDKKSAIDYAKKTNTDTDCDIFISRNSLKAVDVKDFRNKNILLLEHPHLNPNKNGWLIFYNNLRNANWGHPCKYLFIADNTYVINAFFPPSKNIQLTKIN